MKFSNKDRIYFLSNPDKCHPHQQPTGATHHLLLASFFGATQEGVTDSLKGECS